jgi:hypothetical protein
MTDASRAEADVGRDVDTVQISSKKDNPLGALKPWVEKKKNSFPHPGKGMASKVTS